MDPNKPPDLSIAGCYLFFKSQFTYHLYRKVFPDHPIKNLPLYGNNFGITYIFITFFSSLDSRSPLFAIYICANIDPKSRKGHTIQHLEKGFATPWTIESMEFSRPELWSIPQYILQPFLSPGHLPNPGIKPRPPTLWADSLPAEPQGKPENTGVGSLSLLQQMFPTLELNPGLLHCRWILYQLTYGSPEKDIGSAS